jgi:hypothetical protein
LRSPRGKRRRERPSLCNRRRTQRTSTKHGKESLWISSTLLQQIPTQRCLLRTQSSAIKSKWTSFSSTTQNMGKTHKTSCCGATKS